MSKFSHVSCHFTSIKFLAYLNAQQHSNVSLQIPEPSQQQHQINSKPGRFQESRRQKTIDV
ncbi:Protein of unknown function [Pyronema omphalodes CBS 100304]|uniref:Uncharacterized protein n=1 Tax=Pyronema omphalodes (strain CBS 100304) TaxID=1076935 RepID=U4L9M0_PYROM|nr:Protein of unknown function [Pyronema omphalodes CBS 100304]